jgi:hypothetical protein
MRSPFAFEGQIRPLPYALWSIGLFGGQYLFVAAVFHILGQSLNANWRFYVMPLRSVVELKDVPSAVALFAFALTLVVAWMLAALAFRRAANASISGWVAAPVVAPVLQIPTILFLCLIPERPRETKPATGEHDAMHPNDWQAVAQGVLAGMSLTLFFVAAGALVFGTYGYGMFVVSPFMIGATTGYLANRKGDLGRGRTVRLVLIAAALGAVGLLLAALEGAVCIVLAAPLGAIVAAVGGLFGRSAALYTRRSARHTLMSISLLPIVFASEYALPATTTFNTTESVVVTSRPEAIWHSLLHMDSIDSVPALPFRLGVAYPIRGEIVGEGVGALRRGVFSTGVAVERVTEWIPNRKLAFVVLSDPPAMRELSPYKHVNAPHIEGYFRTIYTSFELVPVDRQRTRIIERTSHELKLDPVLYWLPMARWIVHENNVRVLAYIKQQAERVAVP